jgi:hypothetical protein
VKPLGITLSKLAEEWRKNPPAVISFSVAPVIPDKGLSKKADAADWSIAKQYMHLVSRGVRPAIMLESRAGDKADLKSRVIEELIETAVRSLVTSTPTNSIERRQLRHRDPCNNEF